MHKTHYSNNNPNSTIALRHSNSLAKRQSNDPFNNTPSKYICSSPPRTFNFNNLHSTPIDEILANSPIGANRASHKKVHYPSEFLLECNFLKKNFESTFSQKKYFAEYVVPFFLNIEEKPQTVGTFNQYVAEYKITHAEVIEKYKLHKKRLAELFYQGCITHNGLMHYCANNNIRINFDFNTPTRVNIIIEMSEEERSPSPIFYKAPESLIKDKEYFNKPPLDASVGVDIELLKEEPKEFIEMNKVNSSEKDDEVICVKVESGDEPAPTIKFLYEDIRIEADAVTHIKTTHRNVSINNSLPALVAQDGTDITQKIEGDLNLVTISNWDNLQKYINHLDHHTQNKIKLNIQKSIIEYLKFSPKEREEWYANRVAIQSSKGLRGPERGNTVFTICELKKFTLLGFFTGTPKTPEELINEQRQDGSFGISDHAWGIRKGGILTARFFRNILAMVNTHKLSGQEDWGAKPNICSIFVGNMIAYIIVGESVKRTQSKNRKNRIPQLNYLEELKERIDIPPHTELLIDYGRDFNPQAWKEKLTQTDKTYEKLINQVISDVITDSSIKY